MAESSAEKRERTKVGMRAEPKVAMMAGLKGERKDEMMVARKASQTVES